MHFHLSRAAHAAFFDPIAGATNLVTTFAVRAFGDVIVWATVNGNREDAIDRLRKCDSIWRSHKVICVGSYNSEPILDWKHMELRAIFIPKGVKKFRVKLIDGGYCDV